MNGRDDFFTLIHKALRRELFGVAADAAAADWSDERSVTAVAERWRTLESLLHDHSDHEDRHFFALAERKAPGATAALSEQHRVLERSLEGASRAVDAAATGQLMDGHQVHRRIAAFVGEYLPHLDIEERSVMPLLWATCSDAELAATRAAFMADVPPAVGALAMELMLASVNPAERAALAAILAHAG